MKNSDRALAVDAPRSLLSDPKTCAYLLNDALESADAAEVAAAVKIIQKAHGSKIESIGPLAAMSMAEVMDVLENAGVRLVAIPSHRRLR